MIHSVSKYFIAAICCAGAFLAFSYISQKEPVSTNSLIVGVQSGYPPFEFRDEKGNIVGFDIDLSEIIANKLGKELVVIDMDFENEILSLKQGKIDLIVSGMNITPSRLKEIDMIPYHEEATTHFSLIFWNQIPSNVHTLDDIAKLPNPSVSVETGSTPEAFLNHFPAIQAKSFQGSLAPLMDVKFGKSSANLVAQDVALYLQKHHPEIKVLNIPIPVEEQVLGLGIGIKKGNSALLDQVDQIIQELKDSGEMKKLEDKWLKGADNV